MTDKSRFEPDDLLLEQVITDLHVVRAKPLAACAVKSINRETEQYEGSLWTFQLETGEARCFVKGDPRIESPRWSHDGSTLASLSDREKAGTSQVYLMPFDGGEARQLSYLARGATSILWRPQADKLAIIGNVTVDPSEGAEGCDRQDGVRLRRQTGMRHRSAGAFPTSLTVPATRWTHVNISSSST